MNIGSLLVEMGAGSIQGLSGRKGTPRKGKGVIK